MSVNNKLPIILSIIENFGLSSSWTGNALLSANPTNFYSLWEKYPHTVLFPDQGNLWPYFENSEIDLGRLLCGRKIVSDKEFIDQIISENKLSENKVLERLLDETLERNCAIHLIGKLSPKSGQFGDLDQLFPLLKIIKSKKIFRVYLHLILDDSITENPSIIDDFQKKLSSLSIGEIASICGHSFLEDKNKNSKSFSSAVSAILAGRGKQALSPEQALSFQGLSHPSEKPPTSLVFSGKFLCKINNFDTILFFNHNNKSLTRLILALSRESRSFKRIKMPRFLKVATMFNPFDQEVLNLEVLFERSHRGNLFSALSESKIGTLFISDSSRSSLMNQFFLETPSQIKEAFVPIVKESDPANYDQALDLILSRISHSLEENQNRFIVLLIPALEVAERQSFTKTVEVIKLIDKFLPKLEKLILGFGGTLILTSDHGSAEKMSQRDNFETLNEKTRNPIPFIVTTPGCSGKVKPERGVVFNQMIYDMISKKHFERDAAPTILSLLGVDVPEEMTGRSFLSDLKIKI